jgi:hypothetical protein
MINMIYDTTWDMIKPDLWDSLRNDTTWNMTQPQIWYNLIYDSMRNDTTWIMTQPEIWHIMKYDTTWFMTQSEKWYNLNYDTTRDMIQPELTTLNITQPETWHNLLLFRCIANILSSKQVTDQCAASCRTLLWICYLMFKVRLLLQLLSDLQPLNCRYFRWCKQLYVPSCL